jgi:hypothetical protein
VDVIGAAIADARTNALPDQPGTGEAVRIADAGARITYTFLSIAVPAVLLLGSAREPTTIGLGVLGALGVMRAWRIALLADRDCLTVRNFLRTYRDAGPAGLARLAVSAVGLGAGWRQRRWRCPAVCE